MVGLNPSPSLFGASRGVRLPQDPRRALISVSDKKDVVKFAKELEDMDWEIISTGGTFKELHEAGIDVLRISDIISFPEILDGRDRKSVV